jgi:hypothetical protein
MLKRIYARIKAAIITLGELCWEFADWEWGGRIFKK